MPAVQRIPVSTIAAEEQARAGFYRLLAGLLTAPPGAAALAGLAALTGDNSPIGSGLGELADKARAITPPVLEAEFTALFIGIGRGELVPYGSFYLTGFLHEKPLATLRDDMARLGIAASPDSGEPEDHIAALLEMMAGLIDGAFAAPAPLDQQRAFFAAHIAPWATRFFRDLENAEAADFYRPVGRLGQLFMAIEAQAFAMG